MSYSAENQRSLPRSHIDSYRDPADVLVAVETAVSHNDGQSTTNENCVSACMCVCFAVCYAHV